MPSDAICVLHTQIPREPRTEPNEPRFRKILLGLVSVYWLLISVRSRSRPRSKKPDRYRFEPPNRYRAPSSLGSFAGLFVGYDESTHLFQVWDPSDDSFIRERHVIFDETLYFQGEILDDTDLSVLEPRDSVQEPTTLPTTSDSAPGGR